VEWRERRIILDVAHNPAATAFLARGLAVQRAAYPAQKVYALAAMMSDKDRLNSLANLRQSVDYWYLADLSYMPRAASCDQMVRTLDDLQLKAEASGSAEVCLEQILGRSNPGDFIVIFGSFYTVAAGLALLRAESR
jgi:dihydrofolate synthase/folylpolyglutamate synthase